MSRLANWLVWFFPSPPIDSDPALDGWIRGAMLEEALACPPAGAWDRLYQAVVDRNLKHYGMWVLDEPQREPPESLPMALNGRQFERALRIYGNRRYQKPCLIEKTLWPNMVPALSGVLNW